jgi:hypothetical protein
MNEGAFSIARTFSQRGSPFVMRWLRAGGVQQRRCCWSRQCESWESTETRCEGVEEGGRAGSRSGAALFGLFARSEAAESILAASGAHRRKREGVVRRRSFSTRGFCFLVDFLSSFSRILCRSIFPRCRVGVEEPSLVRRAARTSY